jgi:hypothetical protein
MPLAFSHQSLPRDTLTFNKFMSRLRSPIDYCSTLFPFVQVEALTL